MDRHPVCSTTGGSPIASSSPAPCSSSWPAPSPFCFATALPPHAKHQWRREPGASWFDLHPYTELGSSLVPRRSAGLMMYRRRSRSLEVFLVHPGGPFFAKKDHGTWTIPKGEYLEGELPLEAAKREFQEETGFPVPETFLDLGSIKQAGGKIVA